MELCKKTILLKINGSAHTRFSESRWKSHAHGISTTIRKITNYTGHEDYIASRACLLGSDDNISSALEPGINTYNFACNLPTTCPSSFEGLYGHIRYTVRVELIRPWNFDLTFTKGFTVLQIMNLNYDSPLLRKSCDSEVKTTYWSGPWKSDPLKINVNLPQSGYVPGQHIPVNVLVTNDSNIAIKEIKVELVLQAIYHSQHPCSKSKDQTIVVSKLKGDSVLRNGKKLFNYTLQVPATPPSCFNLCSILQIAYQIKVEAKVKGLHANQVIVVPVTIGNVPLTVTAIQQQQKPTIRNAGLQGSSMTTAAVAVTRSTPLVLDEKHVEALRSIDVHTVEENNNQSDFFDEQLGLTSSWAGDANIPPPSYHEAVHMKTAKTSVDEELNDDQCDFTPRYPVFNIPSLTALPPTTFEQHENGGFVNHKVNTADAYMKLFHFQ